MLKDIAGKYYKMGYNCAEATVRAGNDYYNLGLSEHDMRMMAGFGGGLFVKDICGVLSGAIAAISCRYVETKAHDNQEEIKAVVQKMVARFEELMGSRKCEIVKEKYYTKEEKCCPTVVRGAEVFEQVVNEWDAQREAFKANLNK